MIITISGLKRSGKDEVANVLVKEGFQKLSFASPLKDLCSRLYGDTLPFTDAFKDLPFKEPFAVDVANLEREFELLGYKSDLSKHTVTFDTPRRMLQYIGTEVGRSIDDLIWIKLLSKLIGEGNYVIPDARFINEIEFFKSSDSLAFFVSRNMKVENELHESEKQQLSYDKYDVIVTNNGTLADLKEQIQMWLIMRGFSGKKT